MPTGQSIINGALTKLNVVDQSGTPNASDSSYTLQELNNMWSSWSVDEGLIYAMLAKRFPLTANVGFYTIGPGGAMNLPQIPARIYKAIFCTASGAAISASSLGDGGTGYVVNDTGVVLGANGTQATYTVNTVDGSGAVLTYTISAGGTGYQIGNGYQTQTGGAQAGVGTGFTINITTVTSGGDNRNPLKIVEATTYYEHNDLNASAQVPDEVYPDYDPDADGFSRIYLFPVNSVTGTLELDIGVPFAEWTLADNYNLPPGYRDTLEWALAFRCLPAFGQIVDPRTAQVVEAEGVKAEARIRKMNAFNRQLPDAQVVAPGAPMPAQPAARP